MTKDTHNNNNKRHLIVLHHGLFGKNHHLGHLENQLRKRLIENTDNSRIEILNISINANFFGNNTTEGIDICGDRVVQYLELEGKLDDSEYGKISFIGYSLGGLINRYIVGRLYAMGVFNRIEPINFITLATPHLGASKPPINFHNKLFNTVAPVVASRSGQQVILVDNFADTNRPLLQVMTELNGPFWKGLAMFRVRRLFANTANDRTVPYCTAAIAQHNPYRRENIIPVAKDPKRYPSIVEPIQIDNPKSKSKYTTVEKVVFVAFLFVAPVLIPLWIVSLIVFALVVLVIRVFRGSSRKDNVVKLGSYEWVMNEDSSNTTTKEGHFTSAINLPTTHPLLLNPTRLSALQSLNSLTWEKHDVKTWWPHSHAAIVGRNPWVHRGSEDIIQFLIDNFIV